MPEGPFYLFDQRFLELADWFTPWSGWSYSETYCQLSLICRQFLLQHHYCLYHYNDVVWSAIVEGICIGVLRVQIAPCKEQKGCNMPVSHTPGRVSLVCSLITASVTSLYDRVVSCLFY